MVHYLRNDTRFSGFQEVLSLLLSSFITSLLLISKWYRARHTMVPSLNSACLSLYNLCIERVFLKITLMVKTNLKKRIFYYNTQNYMKSRVSVSKVLLELSHAHLFTYYLCCFYTNVAELSNCNRACYGPQSLKYLLSS